jgi:hypothetical protein
VPISLHTKKYIRKLGVRMSFVVHGHELFDTRLRVSLR